MSRSASRTHLFLSALVVLLLASVVIATAGCFGKGTDTAGPDASFDAATGVFDASLPEVGVEAGSDASSLHDASTDGSPSALTIGGSVTGLTGKGLVLRDNGGDDLAIPGNGAFTFKTPVAPGGHYAVTVAAQPSSPTQQCTVAGGDGTATADVTAVLVTCVTASYPVGGTLVGLDPASTGGLVLLDTLAAGVADTVTVDQNGAFTFPKKVPSGGSFAVTVQTGPSSPAQTCAVGGGTGTVVAGAVTSVVVNCAKDAFLVGGSVSGLTGQGLALQNGAATVTIAANGTFAFPVAIASGASYAVSVATQPTGPSQTCTVTGGTGLMGTANVSSVSVACVTNAYAVGGTVSGLAGTGLVLVDEGGDALPVTANGSFTFATPVTSGAQYAVTAQAQPQSPWQTCTVTNGTGIVGATAVTNVQVACQANPYAVDVTVSGVQGTGLTLLDNGGDALAVAKDGTYAFATLVPSGSAYAVTVGTQPAGPTQGCTVAGGGGVVAGSAVSGITITCSTSAYAVGGAVSGLAGTGLVLTDNGGDALDVPTSAASFQFATAVSSGGSYDVEVSTQPTNPSQTCTVSGNKGTVVAGKVTSVVVNCGTDTHTVGGTVTGLAGSGLVLTNGPATLAVTATGSFAFPAVDSGSPYDVQVTTQPSSPTQICTVTGGQGAVGGADVTTVQVACVTQPFTVGGSVSGLAPNTSVVLEDNGGDDLTVSADAPFTFATSVASGAQYAVTVKTQPTNPWQTCITGTTGSGKVGSGPVTGVAVTCTTNPHQVSADVSGLHGTGLALQINGGSTTSVVGDGTYPLGPSLPSGSSYTVTVSNPPTGPWQTCTVGAPGTIADADVTVKVTCANTPFNVGGTVSGLTAAGLQLTNVDDGDVLSVPPGPLGATSFTFPTPVLSGQTFNVTISAMPPSQKCTLTGGQGQVGGADVTTIAVSCGTLTVGGSVTITNGSTLGTGLVLTNAGETLSPTATGSFAFKTQYLPGAAYDVEVTGQPTLPVQVCTASSNTGTVGTTSVNTVAITCTTQTYPVLAAVTGLASGSSLVLADNTSDLLTVTGSGTTAFLTQVPSEGGYAVTIQSQPAGQYCTLQGTTQGTVVSGAVTVNVSCVPDDTLTVVLNGVGGAITVAVNGSSSSPAGSFGVQLQPGSAYSVAVTSAPPGQTCTLEGAAFGTASASGTMSGNVTVAFDCQWNLTVNADNGFSAGLKGKLTTYPACGSLTFNLVEGGVLVDTMTVSATGHNIFSFPSHPAVPPGASIEVDFPGDTASAGGVCTCTQSLVSLTASCGGTYGCPLDLYSNAAVSSTLPTVVVYCGWVNG